MKTEKATASHKGLLSLIKRHSESIFIENLRGTVKVGSYDLSIIYMKYFDLRVLEEYFWYFSVKWHSPNLNILYKFSVISLTKFLRSYSNNKYCILKSAIQDRKSAVNLTLPLSFYVYCLDLLTYKNDTTYSPPLIFLFNEENLKVCSNSLQHEGHIFFNLSTILCIPKKFEI